MHSDIDKVRASNEGHAFHVIWTARRCLRLIQPLNDLVAVVVEGISPLDTAKSKEGILKADTAEYYGSEDFKDSRKFILAQLKYSPSASNNPWTASGVEDTFKAFAKDFNKKCNKFGEAQVKAKAQYVFVTNRPVADSLNKALEAARTSRPLSGHAEKALVRLEKAASLSQERFKLFSELFEIWANEKDRPEQEYQLTNEISQYLPGQDTLASKSLEDFIRKKGLLTDNREPVRRHDILRLLGIPSESDLLPAQPSPAFQLPKNYVPRIQEQEIVNKIINKEGPIIIHASGGMGKSILALRLPHLMPNGSESVVFDGFADGLYRDPSKPRHKYDRGLIQIANELAVKGLCDPFLPSSNADKGKYISAFLHRLSQAVQSIKNKNSNAIVLVVIDAADNLQMGSELEDPNANSFSKDLLITKFPPDCKLVVLARSERVESHLCPFSSIERIQLKPFMFEETAQFLKSAYPKVNDESVREFHRMTSANPRVQFNALNRDKEFEAMMRRLGPSPLGINEMIAQQLENAVSKVRDNAASKEQIDTLCIALAALPPLVPISILSKAANVTEELVYSFISDIGHYLMELDGALHFRDEPVETWFRNKFAQPNYYNELISALQPFQNNSYVASAFPKLLWQAGQMDQLMKLALSDEGLPSNNHVEKRRIVLRRVQFALKAAIHKKRYLDIIKLSIRAGEEVAGNDREANLLLENHDLVSVLFGAKRAQEIVFRFHSKEWLGSGFAYGAAILAGESACQGESRNMLRCAEEWLNHWSKLSQEEREKQSVNNDDIAAMAMAHLFLHGPREMVNQLGRWKPSTISFRAGKIIISRLVDAGKYDLVNQIANFSKKNPFLVLAITNEMAKIGKTLPKEPIHAAIKLLLSGDPVKVDFSDSFNPDGLSNSIISLAEAGAQLKIPKRTLMRFLNRYIPEIPQTRLSADYNKQRDSILRFYCLKTALNGKEIEILDLATKTIKDTITKNGGEHDREVSEFKEVIGVLLSLYKLRTKIILGTQRININSEIDVVKNSTKEFWRSDSRKFFIANEIAPLWLDILIQSKNANQNSIGQLEDWMKEQAVFFYIPVRISMIRVLARCDSACEKAYDFAKRVAVDCEQEKTEAQFKAENLASLARSVLTLGINEAKIYFNNALEIVNRFGDEIWDRWQVLLALAFSSGSPDFPNPKIAYEFSRISEVISDYLTRHFSWEESISAISKLCPPSAFSILSRWTDREVGYREGMIISLTMFLLKEDLLSPSVAFSLNTFNYEPDFLEFLEIFFQKEKDHGRRRFVFSQVIRHLQIQGEWDNSIKYKNLFSKYGLSDDRLEEMVNFSNKIKITTTNKAKDYPKLGQNQQAERLPNWDEIISNRTFLTSNEIDDAFFILESFKPNWPIDELLNRMINNVTQGKETVHLKALLNSSSLHYLDIIHALENAKEKWKSRVAVQSAIRDCTSEFVEKKTSELTGGSLNYKLEKLEALGALSRNELVFSLLKGTSDSVEEISSSGFFSIAKEVIPFLNQRDSMNAFQYALERNEIEIKEDDGDGSWNQNLIPPDNIDSAVAGFIYTAMASPIPETRWEAAHSVVKFCNLNEENIVLELINCLDQENLSAFTDKKLPFYSWHSRLYLMIAFSRAAQDVPNFFINKIDTLLNWALAEPSHVLIRHFAAQTVLTVENNYPGTISKEQKNIVKNVNVSSFAPKLPDKEKSTGWNMGGWSGEEFLIPFDFDRYWVGPLSEIFDLQYEEVARPISEWALKEGAGKTVGKWDDDPRSQSGYYQSKSSIPRYGSYPEVDSLSFYLCYHALFFVAADLLSKEPTVKSGNWKKDWNEWLQEHLLTRSDGFWLADIRGPVPLEQRRWQMEELSKINPGDWKWSVLSTDFDDALMIKDKKTKCIVVRGYWNFSENNRRENIHIRSALVSQDNSFSLLKALQTVESFHDFLIPDSGSDLEIDESGFQLHGWTSNPHSDPRLDSFDPLSGQTPWPVLQPSKKTCRLLKLERDSSKRVWRKDGEPVIFLDIWGNRKEDRDNSASNYGEKLIADLDFALDSLNKIRRDLIIEVTIKREDSYGQKTDYEDQDYNRLYLLKSNGQICTLYGSRFLRKTSNKRT